MAMSDNYILWSWAIFLMVVATGMSSQPPSPGRSQHERSGQPNFSPIGLYIYRSRWLPFLSNIIPEHAYHRLNPSFEGDIEAGLR